MVRTDFPLPSVENYETARSELIATLNDTSYSLAGLAMIQKLGKDTWSLSLVTDAHPYKPETCSQVLAEIRELFKDYTNIKLDDPSVMYAQIPVTHASMWRFQIRMSVTVPATEVEERDKVIAPGVRSLGYEQFPRVKRAPPPRSPSPSLPDESRDPLDVLGPSDPTDPLYALCMSMPTDPREEFMVRDRDTKFDDIPPILRRMSCSTSSVSSKSSTTSEMFTVENVLSFDKTLIIQKYKEKNPKKLNIFFSLRRQALKAKKNTPQEAVLRVLKKVLVRGMEFALTGEPRPWKPKYNEKMPDTLMSTSYVFSRMTDRTKADLGVARSLAIISQCKGEVSDKFNTYRRYLAQNYLLQRNVNLHTDYGKACPKQLLIQVAQYNKMSTKYYSSLKGYDHLLGFDRKKVMNIDPTLSHQFCQHDVNP